MTPESDSKSYFTFYIDDTIDTEPDGIDAPVSGQPHPTAVYNLQGQKLGTINQNQDTRHLKPDARPAGALSERSGERTRNLNLDRLPKGIYIVGGKKIIVP